jgi:CRP-like cAMP-binding protein
MPEMSPLAPSYPAAVDRAPADTWHGRFDACADADLLPFIDAETSAAVRERVQTRRFPKGATLFAGGDEPDGMYRIISGKVKAERTPAGAPANLLGVYGPGQVIGALSVCDPAPRNATAIALTDCELAFLSREDAEHLFATVPAFARCIMTSIARNLRLAQNATSALVLQDVAGRVARAVILLATRFGTRRADGTVHVRHDITQADIAAMIGCSREAVNKAMAEFVERGWVTGGTKQFIVLDYDRLVRRSGGFAWEQVKAVSPVSVTCVE